MHKSVVQTAAAPAAIGPYSQAMRVGDMVYCSGQIALDPASGQLVEGDVTAQAQQVLRNLEAVLKAAQSGMDRVVKTTIFLTDMADFATVNEVYGQYFKEAPPARSTIQVAGLPRGARVEIEAIAYVGA